MLRYRFEKKEILCLGLLLIFTVGCGGTGVPTAEVHGVVTLDGMPLDRATVQFQPEKGRMSIGITDSSGQYTLQFTGDQSGAMLGNHSVIITSEVSASGGEGDQPAVQGRAEILPAKYNEKSTLTANVVQGDNTIDFPLESK